MKNKPEKKFDAVAMMREIRDKISEETQDMTFEELRAYIDAKLSKKRNEKSVKADSVI